jgi:hypothetical protein
MGGWETLVLKMDLQVIGSTYCNILQYEGTVFVYLENFDWAD